MTHFVVLICSFNVPSLLFQIDPCNDFYEYVCGNYIKKSVKNIASIMDDMKERLNDQLRGSVHQAFQEGISDPGEGVVIKKTVKVIGVIILRIIKFFFLQNY